MKHALFDTYAIGSERALFENAQHLHVYKIYDYASTYGIVIGRSESRVLQKCFNMFKIGNIENIFRNIKEKIDSIEVRCNRNFSLHKRKLLSIVNMTSTVRRINKTMM